MSHHSALGLASASLPTLLILARAMDEDDSPAMSALVRRFEPLVMRIAAPFRQSSIHDDVVNAGRYAIVTAVRNHDINRPGFPKFAEKHIRGAIFRRANQMRVPEDVIVSLDHVSETAAADEIIVSLDRLAPYGDGKVASIVRHLTSEQQQILNWRYIDDLTMKEIAARKKISVPAVSQRFATIHAAVRDGLAG